MSRPIPIFLWGAPAWAERVDPGAPATVQALAGVDDPVTALREAFAREHGPLAVVDGRVALPPGWLGRLAAGLEADPLADAVTPLDPGHPLLTPWNRLAQPTLDPVAADRLVRMFSERGFYQQRALSPAASLWRRPPPELASLARPSDLEASSCRILTCDHVMAPAERAATARTGPLDLLRYRLYRALASAVPDGAALRADDERTVLHVTHGWGGGTHRWVTDLIEALDDRRHLVLMARGDSAGHDCGRRLELRIGAVDSPPVRTWPLPSSIRSVAVHSPEHAAVFATVLRDWGVGQVIVSSLIGHSLEVLESGLPTLVVCHDYFPAWPNLDVAFEEGDAPFDRTRLAGTDASRRWFPDLGPERWEQVRDAYLERLAHGHVRLVAPSRSVAVNLERLHPGFAALPLEVVPHGHRALPAKRTAQPGRRRARSRRSGRRWRVLVPGRIAPGKGKALVSRLGERFGEQLEFFLLGAGHDGHDFFGRAGFHVVLQYERDELPRLVTEIAPDFALLASTVSETFSYTLSEMWALGLPVVATRRGALAERITDGVDGALFEPDAEDFGRLLDRLAEEDLAAWRAAIATRELPGLAEMGARYAALLPAPEPRAMPVHRVDTAHLSQLLLAGEGLELGEALRAAEGKLEDQTEELDRRGSWGFAVSRELDERTRWAQRLDADLALARERLDQRERQLEERLNWARALDGELETARERLEAARHELEARTRWARQLDTTLTAYRERVAALQSELEDRTAWASELDHRLAEAEAALAGEREAAAALRGLLAQEQARSTGLATELEETTEQLAVAAQGLADRDRRLADMTAARDAAQREFEHIQAWHQQVITSRSWRLTRPLRVLARTLRRAPPGAIRRVRRGLTLAGRARRSLAVRGLGGTLARIGREFRRPRPPATPVPVTEADRTDPLVFPRPEAPAASVIIPVHNHFEHTRRCLASLRATRTRASFEVVVVDDASSDETPGALAAIAGIVHLTNPENLGFVGTCNHGAAKARGEYLVFLNNDTAVTDGWLDALLETFERCPDAGLVGAKLVYPDGRLQEAGGIVFADGSGWNYGRFDDPDHPAYNYLREVDYCSGAAIAVPRALFRELGAFDARYAPAYYEDTDLAFAVRSAGRRVYYQPRSTIVHFEGVTAGTDTASGIKRYQVVNQEKFLARWPDALARQQPPGTPIVRARDHGRARRVLVIDACTPEPDKDSGSVRMVHLLAILRELGYQVSFLAENRAYAGRYSDALRDAGVEVWFHPWADHWPRFFERTGDTFDAAIVSRHYVAVDFLPLLRRHCPSARILFDTVDLHFLREQRLAELAGDARLVATAKRTREQELGVARACDVTLVVSPYEQQFLAREAPELEVTVVSNIHRVHGRRVGWAARRDLLFVGGYQHPPNIDAAIWFAREIFPRVRRELPEVRFHVVGSRAPREVERLDELEGVVFHGFVEDLVPYLDGCRLALAPLRYGAGVKGKVNSSMSYGQPVVATPPAVEGMFARPGEDVLVAETAAEFAAAVVAAYRDEALWTRLSDNGLENVRRYFSFDAARAALAAALAEPAPEAVPVSASPGS